MRKHCAPLGWPRRDPRRYRFALPNSVWDCCLKVRAFVILSYLCCQVAHGGAERLTPKVIAEAVHMTAPTVKKHLSVLAERGLIASMDDPVPTIHVDHGSGNYFTLPNEIFLLHLPPSSFAVYAYLLSRENRGTHQCRPSYRTMAAVTGQATATVIKAVSILVEMGLIRVDEARRFDDHGLKWKDNNLYTILPVAPVMEAHYRRQMATLEREAERRRIQERQAKLNRRHPTAAQCSPPSYTER